VPTLSLEAETFCIAESVALRKPEFDPCDGSSSFRGLARLLKATHGLL